MLGLDDVLRSWPEARADDARVATILQRVEGDRASMGPDDEVLFAAPVLEDASSDERGEREETRARDRQNFQDLARLAHERPSAKTGAYARRAGTARGEDSGIVDLSILPEEEPAPAMAPPPAAALQPATTEAPAPIAAHAEVQQLRVPPQRRRAIPLLVTAVAAAAVLWLRLHETPRAAVAPTTATAAAASVAAAPPLPPEPAGIDPAALPESKAGVKAEAKAVPAARPTVVAHGEAAKPVTPVAPPPQAPAVEAARPPEDLNAALRKEVGDNAIPKTPAAAFRAGDVPQTPSQGAVTGALGAVLPQARACLGPDDSISKASIVFTANGGVQSVKVAGGAAGRPAEACIRDALSKARVQPFAEPTYPASITIRHL